MFFLTRKCGLNLKLRGGMRDEKQPITVTQWLEKLIYLSGVLENINELNRKSFKAACQSCFGDTSVVTYNWFWLVFDYMTSELKVVSDLPGRCGHKFSHAGSDFALKGSWLWTVYIIISDCHEYVIANLKLLFILTSFGQSPEWNQNQYTSVTRPFPLKSEQKGKVEQKKANKKETLRMSTRAGNSWWSWSHGSMIANQHLSLLGLIANQHFSLLGW